MRKHIINLVRGIIVIAVFAAILLFATRILVLKSEDGYTQIRSLYRQDENSVDVLFLGSSRIYCGIDTGILWDDYGIAAFDLGGAEAPAWNSYLYLKEALKTQKPKLIVYDAAIIGVRREFLHQVEFWLITNLFGMKWNENRVELLKLNAETKSQFKRLFFPLDNMHSRYKEITKNDFIDKNSSINYKGFDFRDNVAPMDTPDMSGIDDEIELDEKHLTYFRSIIALAKSYNIPLVVTISPFYLTEDDMRAFNHLKRICEEEGVPYINFNEKYDELGFDFETDLADVNHINFSGTKKYSNYFGTYIKENYDIPDRREDAGYSSWAKAALVNRQNRLAYDLNHAESDEDFESLKNNNTYVVFYNNDGLVDVTNNGNVLIAASDNGELNVGDTKLLFKPDSNGITLFINNVPYSLSNGRMIIYDTILEKDVYDGAR